MKRLLFFVVFVLLGCVQDPIVEEPNVPADGEEPDPPAVAVEELADDESVNEESIDNEPVVEEVPIDTQEPVPPEESTPPAPPIVPPEPEPQPKIINGKTVEERLTDAYDNLHVAGSSAQLLKDFPDLELVYTDNAGTTFFPSEILPFHYYYSEEADKTFNLCGIGRSVFICDGKLERTITEADIDEERCVVTPIYLQDPRIGGSGDKYSFD